MAAAGGNGGDSNKEGSGSSMILFFLWQIMHHLTNLANGACLANLFLSILQKYVPS